MEKQKEKDETHKGITEKTKHKQAREIVFPPPPLHAKNTSRLSLKTSPLFATSSLVSLKTSLPRTKSLSPYAQDTRLRVYTRSRTQRISHFCLHPSPYPTTNCISIGWGWRQTLHSPSPSPQQPEFQHIARHPLQKTGEGKTVKPSPVTHTCSTLYTQKVKRWRQKHKITGRARVRMRTIIDMSRMRVVGLLLHSPSNNNGQQKRPKSHKRISPKLLLC